MKTIKPKNAQSDLNRHYTGQDELWIGERYCINYNQDLISKLTRHQNGATDVLEFGAGIGTLAHLWEQSTGIKPECLEIDPKQKDILIQRGFHCYDNLSSVNKSFELIYTSNVLEHIENDLSILYQLNSKIKIGGTLVIYVPAFQILYSDFDEKLGHYRRYEKKDLLEKLNQAGFRINHAHFSDSIGFLTWLYIKMKGYTSSKSEAKKIRVYDQYIFPVSRLFDTLGCKYLFGKNLLIYAQKI